MTSSLIERTGAQILVDQLLIHGVEHAFCVPGESYLAVLDALYAVKDRIHLTINRHESGATFMADAYGKMTGKPGIALVTRGPGATNASVAVHTAYQDSTPLILFIGQVGSDFVDREAFQEIDYRRMFGQMTKWVAQIERADRIPEYIARAFQVATSGRSGPVVLALPEDMQLQNASVCDAIRYHPVQAGPSLEQLTALHARLSRAQRPIVLLGGAGWTPLAAANIEHFAEENHLPVACVFRRQDLFDNRHPNYAGDVGIGINPKLAQRIREADVVLAVGPRLGEMTTSGYTLFHVPTPKQALVHVHASAEELGRVMQPALAINSGPEAAAAALCTLAAVHEPVWRESVVAARQEYEAWQAEPAVFSQRPQSLNLYRILEALFQKLPDDALLANGAGNFATWGHRFHRYTGLARGRRTQLAPTSGTMGYGVPAGIAAKIIAPDQSVVILSGDGDFLMTGQELATAAQYQAAVLILVVNNGMYGTIRMHQEREYPGRVYGTGLANPDFAALAQAYGAFGAKVTTNAEFEPALAAALAYLAEKKMPALIELVSDPEIISPALTIQALRQARR
ncbi:MAG: thiamine pyrophosphate-binding protein [Burkholderiaceae bacterium]